MFVGTDAALLPDPATPIFGAVTIVTVNNTTSGVVAVPTGTTEHDRLVLWIAKTEAATFTGLTGWTQTIAEESVPGAMLYAYEKEADATDADFDPSANTYTVGWTGADDAVIYMINVDQCGASTFKATATGISDTPTCPAVTTGSANNMVLRAFAAVGASVNNAVSFDGTNDCLARGAELTGNADGKVGLFSGWLEFAGGDGARQIIFDDECLVIERTAANVYQFRGFTEGDFSVDIHTFLLRSDSTWGTSAGWHHLLAAWDLASGVKQLYVSDADDRWADSFTADGTIDYTRGNSSVGALLTSGGKLQANVADLYLNLAETLDISIEANRRKFITADGKPASLGLDGSTPTGTAPIVFLSGKTESWHINKGTGGGFTETGELTYATTSPFDPAGMTVVAMRASPNNLVSFGLAYEVVAAAGTEVSAAAFALT